MKWSLRTGRLFMLLGDVASILVATKLAQWIRFGRYYAIFEVETGASFFTLFIYITMMYIFDMYNGRHIPSRKPLLRLLMAVGLGGLVSVIIFYSLPQWQFGRGIFLLQMVIALCLLVIWRYGYDLVFSSYVSQENVLVIGAGDSGKKLCQLLQREDSPYRVAGFLDDQSDNQEKQNGHPHIIGRPDQLIEICAEQKIRKAIFTIDEARFPKLLHDVLQARLKGIEIIEEPVVYEQMLGIIPVTGIDDHWLLFSQGFNLISKEYIGKIKRLIDFWTAWFILIATFPIMLLTALAIRIDSPGPILYRQKRVGLNEQNFIILKFRSMKKEAEHGEPVWASENDPRITRVGNWIRLLRIDELPQIINVLRGEMSLIGPRPERPEFVDELKKEIPYYSVRHSVRPGITGWAQIYYPYGASMEDALRKLEYDLYYIKNMSLLLDLKILLKTIGVMLLGQGAR